MEPSKIIQSQTLAALEMLKQVLVTCPAALWNAPGDKDKFLAKSLPRFTTTATSNYTQANSTNAWERVKISSSIGWVSSPPDRKIIRSKNV